MSEWKRFLCGVFALVVLISHSCTGKTRVACLLESNVYFKKKKVRTVIKLRKKHISDVSYMFPW